MQNTAMVVVKPEDAPKGWPGDQDDKLAYLKNKKHEYFVQIPNRFVQIPPYPAHTCSDTQLPERVRAHEGRRALPPARV